MMAHKYDTLTVPTTDAPKKHHPWYRERLKLKFINPSKQTAALNGRKWTFVASDIDDFRTGVPCQTRGKRMVKLRQTCNPLPLVSEVTTSPLKKSKQPEPKIMSNNPGLRTLYSKVGPRRQVKLERFEREKTAVLDHPLQVYPHLEDSIPVELLDGVLEVIDPGLKIPAPSTEELSGTSESMSCISSESEENDDRIDDVFSPGHLLLSADRQQPHQPSKLYKFPLKKTKEEREREKMMAASQQVISASQQNRVDQVTHELVQWMADLDDDKAIPSEMDEDTIKSLFSTDYDSRPAQVAPIHVVELVNVPAELRLESRDHSRSGYSSSPSLKYAPETQYQYGSRRMRGLTYPGREQEEPRYVRCKYGAWYLPIDLWRSRNENKPLRDPKEEAAELECEETMKNLAMDEALADLHGAKMFKEFIVTKKRGSMVPTFLDGVELNSHLIQSQNPRQLSRRK